MKFRELPLALRTADAARLNVYLVQCEFSDVYKNGPSTKARFTLLAFFHEHKW
jgi:hypothetical protein